MKIWVDDVRPAPDSSYIVCNSVNKAKWQIALIELLYGFCEQDNIIELIDLDHDAGDFIHDGGDYIKILDWLETTGRNYPIRLHTMNPVGAENMRRIIQKNGWKEVF